MEGADEQRFDVYVTAFGAEEDRAVGLLQERLELDAETARNLYHAVPVHVCSGLSEEVARAHVEALLGIGSQVTLVPARGEGDVAQVPSASAMGSGWRSPLPPTPPPLLPSKRLPTPPTPPSPPGAAASLAGASPASAPPPLAAFAAPPAAGLSPARVTDPEDGGMPAIAPPPRSSFGPAAKPSPPPPPPEGPMDLVMASNAREFMQRDRPRDPQASVARDPASAGSALPVIEPLLSPEERKEREAQGRIANHASDVHGGGHGGDVHGGGYAGIDHGSLTPGLPGHDGGPPALPGAGVGSGDWRSEPALDLDRSLPPGLGTAESPVPPALRGDESSLPPALMGGASSLPPALMGDDGSSARALRWAQRIGGPLGRGTAAIARGTARLHAWAHLTAAVYDDIDESERSASQKLRGETAIFLLWALDLVAPWAGRATRWTAHRGAELVDRAERALVEEGASEGTAPEEAAPAMPDGVVPSWTSPRMRRRVSSEPPPLSDNLLLMRGIPLLFALGVFYGGMRTENSIFWGSADLPSVLVHGLAFYAFGLALRPGRAGKSA